MSSTLFAFPICQLFTVRPTSLSNITSVRSSFVSYIKCFYINYSLYLYITSSSPSVYNIPGRCPCSCNCFGLANKSVNLNETGKGRLPRLIREDSTCSCLFRCLRQYVAVLYEEKNSVFTDYGYNTNYNTNSPVLTYVVSS